jgi:bifunctional aspartokinase / homoserine dehydrogenase 1
MPIDIAVGVIGEGLVGGALLSQIRATTDSLLERYRIHLHVCAIARTTTMALGDHLDLDAWAARALERQPVNLEVLAAHMLAKAPDRGHAVICDCTASADVSALYAIWLRLGIHVVTANKKANSGPTDVYQDIAQAQSEGDAHLRYEATVGAGLPVISTIQDLIRTGDLISRIEGVLSGTVSFIFNEFDGSEPFSTVVKRAKSRGYTEPDPRDDLSGKDVARKVVILAREVGLDVNLDDVAVKSLVPQVLQSVDVSAAQFMERLADFDAFLNDMASNATRGGNVLRYVGVVNVAGKECAVELREYPRSHPFGGLQLADNMLAITSRRYNSRPLIIQGPGAGADVTAGGVFANMLRLFA